MSSVKKASPRESGEDRKDSKAPDYFEELVNAINQIMEDGHRLPVGFPAESRRAAKYWIEHQPPMERIERPHKKYTEVSVSGKKETIITWLCSYNRRLIHSLWNLVGESAESQSYIIEHIENGVKYYGDDNTERYDRLGGLTLFENIVKETYLLREKGLDDYKKHLNHILPYIHLAKIREEKEAYKRRNKYSDE